MAAPVVAVILGLIRAGVPAAKIIAKYGKKAYEAAKKMKAPKVTPKNVATGVTGAFVASSFTPSSRVDKKIEAPSKKSPHKD